MGTNTPKNPTEDAIHAYTAADNAAKHEPDTAATDIEAQCRERICPVCTTFAEAEDVRLRSLAEMENFKKRLLREREEQSKYATEAVLADLLPALDSLDLAILYGSREEACKDMLMGVTMTRKMLLDAVKQHGLHLVGELGEAFNPDIHEAVSQDERDDIEPGLVCSLMQRGYRLKDRLLRPAKVCVSCKPSTHA